MPGGGVGARRLAGGVASDASDGQGRAVDPRLVRFALQLFVFVVGLAALDRAVGAGLDAAMARIRTGEGSGAVNAVLDHRDVDVMVFGSSRAKQHVDPAVIHAVTGRSGYNAAANGQGVPYAVALQALLRARGAQVGCWVLHVDVVDLTEPKVDRVAVLMPFAREAPAILELAASVDRWAPVKAWSSMWRYNGVALAVLRNLFAARPAPEDVGFVPRAERRAGFADDREFLGRAAPGAAFRVSPAIEGMLDTFVDGAGGRVLLVTSPLDPPDPAPIDAARQAARSWLEAYARRAHVTYRSYDESSHPEFREPALFVDGAHLGPEGARRLSAEIARDLPAACPTPTPSSTTGG